MEGAREGMMERSHLDDAAYIIYTGQEDVPDGVIRVRVHPSVRVICGRAFIGRKRLISVEFLRWAQGDWGVGILLVHLTSRNIDPPLRKGD